MKSNKLEYSIHGMTCAACQGIIEKETLKLNGVLKADVSVATEKGFFEVTKDFNEEEFHSLLSQLGYKASSDVNAQSDSQLIKKEIIKVVICIILATLVMVFSMFIMNNILSLILTTIIIIFFGAKYLKALTSFKSNMNTLIGLGVISSYIYSCYLIYIDIHAHNYLEGAAFIVAFTNLGQLLDQIAKTKAKSDLGSLYKMQMKFAAKVVDGKIENTPVKDLVIGDIIRIKPGEKIPLDSRIIKGISHIDESLITGESRPIEKTINDSIIAGSINLEGTIEIEILSQLNTTFISGIIKYVEHAQANKSKIQLFADKTISYFVPTVIVLAIITFIAWFLITKDFNQALIHFVSVLVIACPCALGLAVPMAIMISTSKAAKDGLLINGGEAIEKAHKINSIIFDKTGTLTKGEPVVEEIICFSDYEKDQLIKEAGSCAIFSNHPLSKSVVDYCKTTNIQLRDPDSFKNLPGLGLKATLSNDVFHLGNFDLMKSINAEALLPSDFYKNYIGSYVFVMKNSSLVGVFVINDPIKEESFKCIKDLKNLNFQINMVTGDNDLVAQSVGSKLGIDKKNIYSNIKPIQKAEILQSLKDSGKVVAMIGDGINDAPALIKSDLSMAMSNGSDIAIESSDISILNGDISLIPMFFKRSHKTLSVIKSNLTLAIIYNALCIPLAMGLFYPFFKVSLSPIYASLAMAISSFSVLINSFRSRNVH